MAGSSNGSAPTTSSTRRRRWASAPARLLDGRMLEFLALDAGFALARSGHQRRRGRPLTRRHRSARPFRQSPAVVCVKPEGGAFTYATADTVLGRGDIIVVAGETAKVEAIARLR